ncbi:MAG: hypothetical protein WC851_03205 [Candidatus Shapirobacteria bacterium]
MKLGKLDERAQALVNDALIQAGLLPDPNAGVPKRRVPQIFLTEAEQNSTKDILLPAILAEKLGVTIEDARKILAGEYVKLPESIMRPGVSPLGRDK